MRQDGTKAAVLGLVLLIAAGAGAAPPLDQNAAYSLLRERVGAARADFYVYRDADSGLNHGFPSGFFADSTGTLSKIHIDTACIDDPAASNGCSTDDTRLDRTRGNVLRITFDPLTSGQYVGINIEEPEGWGSNPRGAGYDLRGATAVVFDVRSPTPGGVRVQFGVAGAAGAYVLIPQSTTYTTMTITFASLGLTSLALENPHILFGVAANNINTAGGGTVLLDNIRFTPTPTAQASVLSFPVGNETFGVLPRQTTAPGRVPIPPDQVNRNVAPVYEAALTLMALLDRGTSDDLASARVLAEAFHYALGHDNDGLPLPTAPDGATGLHNAYESGDLPLRNHQGPGAGQAGDVRLAGFTAGSTLCGPSKFCLMLDGATGGNAAFAILALLSAYHKLDDARFLDDARILGRWVAGNLTDTTNTGYGGYYLGYPDEGAPKVLIQSKSTENNADLYAAFTALAAAEQALGNTAEAGTWTTRATRAGDFVMNMFEPVAGRFYAGTVPSGTAPGPGITPDGPQQGNDVINTFDFLDSQSFSVLAMAASAEYGGDIDWRRPVQWFSGQDITVTADGSTFTGFSIVPTPTAGPNGVAWEFTGQAVYTMCFIDALYGQTAFQTLANTIAGEIDEAQSDAPFGDGRGLVASTMQDGDLLAPLEHCLSTPFQCIPQRVGLAATTWALFAARSQNPLALPPPPAAAADLFRTSSAGAPGVLANDTLNRATIVSYGASTGAEQTTIGSATPTARGGSVTLQADGSFAYTFPPGSTGGVDTFRYVLANTGGRAAATVTIHAGRRADFDNNGKADILWRHATTGENYLWTMDGFAVVSVSPINTVSDTNWKIAGAGDFNGDGASDILWRHAVTGENYMYLMNGPAIANAGPVNTIADPQWTIAGTGDYDGDGKADILWRHGGTGENYLYLMNGLAIAAAGPVPNVPDTNWTIAGSGDLNGDGTADLVWRYAPTGAWYGWLMNGFTRTAAGPLPIESSRTLAAVADFDGDTKADLFLRDGTNNYVYRMNGLAVLASAFVNTVADPGWQVAAAADHDGDGRSDILWRHATTGENYLYRMNGTTIAAAGPVQPVPDTNWKIIP